MDEVVVRRREVRLEARIRNNRLWHVIHVEHGTVAAFCETHGLEQSRVGELLNLKCSSLRKDGTYIAMAVRLATIAKMLIEDLFPPALYETPAESVAMEIPMSALSSATRAALVYNAPEPDDLAARLAVHAALRSLKPQEERVVKMRFGIDGPQMTLTEVGAQIGVSKERVRQIEHRAIRSLRYGNKGKRLRTFAKEAV